MTMKFYHIAIGLFAAFICAAAGSDQAVITFLDKKQAAQEIVNDSLEPYFDQLQEMEMAAKTGSPLEGATIAEKRKRCRERYQAGVLEFTPEEQAAIQSYINKLKPVLVKDYPLFGNMPWSFLKVSNNIEGGLPHTRGKHIILSESTCKSLAGMKKLPPGHMAHIGAMELLTHEQMHVFQRTHPGCLDSLYTGLWGFLKADSIAGCKWLTRYHLANPDAVVCNWVLPVKKNGKTEFLWPLVVFSEGEALKKMPGDFRMIAVSVEKKGKGFAVQTADNGTPLYRPLLRVPEFRRLFPMSSNIYHPAEAAADIFAKIIVFDNFIPATALPPAAISKIDQALAPSRWWFKKNLKKNPVESRDGQVKSNS
jgi:hypothetical protein